VYLCQCFVLFRDFLVFLGDGVAVGYCPSLRFQRENRGAEPEGEAEALALGGAFEPR